VILSQIKSWRFARGCPSEAFTKIHTYSASGKMGVSLALLEGRFNYSSEGLLDIAYKCQLCGSCDVACKVCRYFMEPLEMMRELRARLVEEGQLVPEHMFTIDGLRAEDNMMSKTKGERGNWIQGCDVKSLAGEKGPVLFHAGCRLSFDEELSPTARKALEILKKAGVEVGVMGKDETCCGGRAYDLGYRGEFTKYAEHNTEAWRSAGVKTVVTCCSDCYYAFKVLYAKYGLRKNVEVLHVTEFLERLVAEGKIKFARKLPMKVTYHDPCHLGRLAEDYAPWNGKEKKIKGQIVTWEPKRPIRRGANGIYETPRSLLRSIPGIELVEMERTREYAWCCGAAGGAKEAYPDFALWTAKERIEEAQSTGADALVTACPWCERNFLDAVPSSGSNTAIYDIVDLVGQAM
jgi:Fe-S oxidoreductase